MGTILVIDDVPANIKIMGEILRGRYDIIVATTGSRAIELAREEQPDLILLDVMMPDMDGYEVCRTLKTQPESEEIPVIFITALTGTDDIVRGFESGGVDYIIKPFNPRELLARVATHFELVHARKNLALYTESLEELGQQLLNKSQELNTLVEKLNVAARTDFLTELANRTSMMERLKEESARHRRNGRSFTVIIADIDHFKLINDTHGHECGDQVLKTISSIMRAAIREQDVIARWGGEEFLFLLTETDAPGAAVLAEKVRLAVESASLQYDNAAIAVTVTMGVTTFDQALGIDGTIRRADDALYEGKHQGRNRVIMAP